MLAALLLLAAGSQAARAASPGWKILGVTGPTNLPLTQSETQQLTVTARNGTYTLTFQGQITEPIAFNAVAADVASALDALSTIGGAGGSVTVSGGTGGAFGGLPYVITFGGSLASTDVPELTADSSQLGPAFSGPGTASVTTFSPGGHNGSATMAIYAVNVGGASSAGATTVAVTLPPGITTLATPSGTGWSCTPAGVGQGSFTCTGNTAVGPGLVAAPIVAPIARSGSTAGTRTAHLSVSGGGAAGTASYDVPIVSSSKAASAGVQALIAGAYDADGHDETQAGAHPHSATTMFLVNTILAPNGEVVPAGNPRDIRVDLPPGFIGNPLVTPRCPVPGGSLYECSTDTIIGVAGSVLSLFGARAPGNAVFNDTPPVGAPAEFAFRQGTLNIALVASLRSDGDYGVTITSPNTPQSPYNVLGAFATIWGTPADPVHDTQRCLQAFLAVCALTPTPSNAVPPRPLLTNPMDCAAEALRPPTTTLRLNSWQHPTAFDSMNAVSPAVTGCDQLAFQPSLAFTPDTNRADAPMGASVDLDVPQPGLSDPAKLGTPALKKTVVKLPAGVSINPAAANGLAACSTQQIGLIGTGFDPPNRIRFNKAAPSCPDGSKIGTVRIDTPLLDHPVKGTAYLAAQNDNPFHSLFAMYLVVNDPETGIIIKLPGLVQADERTGQVTATFDDNPQLPFTKLHLRLRGGSRAPLATPKACGSHSTTTILSSWSAPWVADVSSVSPFGVACRPGLGRFGPSFSAGTVGSVARGSSPFVLRIDKPDGQSDMNGISLTLPEGLLASLKGNVGRQIGTASVGAGPGPTPFWLSGPVVLEGPYGDAPFSLRVTVPVIAGPFNLGNVVVRQKIYVDRQDAHVTVVSDPLPTIVKGVPVRLQNLRVNVDKAGFMLNPSDCSPKQVGADIVSVEGTVANLSNPFQASGCAALPFKPKLALRLTGRKQTKTGKHPGIKAKVNQTGIGEAGIEKAVVRLPKSLALDPDNAQALCEFEDGTRDDLENHCPKGSIVGRSRATSPLLNDPLVGNVYFVKNVRIDKKTGNQIRTLPMIMVALRGEIAINLTGKSSTTKAGKLVNTFASVPDAPISRFNLNIKGGKTGIIAVTRTRKAKINLCAGRHIAETDMDGQNGRRHDFDVRMKTPCTRKQTKNAKRAAKRAAIKARKARS